MGETKALRAAIERAERWLGRYGFDLGREDEAALRAVLAAAEQHEQDVTPRPLSEWHEDTGPVLWWAFPVSEPPYVGDPLCFDWPGYHTHWTPLPAPPMDPTLRARAKAGGAG